MLFFSSDRSEVELGLCALADAGIPCEIRGSPGTQSMPSGHAHVELWIERDKDRHRALMMCAELGIGFSKRAQGPPIIDY
jgi:hypothetical protein